MALIAASLMLSGVSKSGSPARQADHVAARRLQLARLAGHRDGGRRLDAAQRLGQKTFGQRHGSDSFAKLAEGG